METIPLVVLSCDKYSDLWDGFFHQWNKNVELPFKKYLISNQLSFANVQKYDINQIKTGEDLDWSSSLLNALSQIKEKKIFLILEDLFVSEKVKTEALFNMLEFAHTMNAQHIKYFASPKGEEEVGQYLRYVPGMPYIVSACGLWDREYLMNLLIPGESPWAFEVNASYRASYSAKHFYSPIMPLIKYKNMVEKGGWIPASLSWALAHGVPVQETRRKINNANKFWIKNLWFKAMLLIPWSWRVRLASSIKKITVTY